MDELLKRITIEEGKLGGKPCIRGLRIRVQDILEMLADGASADDVLDSFPYLERDDIRAAYLCGGRSEWVAGRASLA